MFFYWVLRTKVLLIAYLWLLYIQWNCMQDKIYNQCIYYDKVLSNKIWQWASNKSKTINKVILYVAVLSFSSYFFIGIEKSVYFSVTSSRHSNCHCTKNHISFFQMSWKDGLSKKLALEYDLSYIIGKDDISFSRKHDLML